jgi:protein-serine/threonine kinase
MQEKKNIDDTKNIDDIFDKYIKEKYVIITKINTGSNSNIYKIKEIKTEIILIMKLINKEDVYKKDKVNRIMMEKEILLNVRHPLIISNYEIYECEKYYYFINEYCPDTLHDVLIKNVTFNEEWIKFYCSELLCAIEFLHHKGYVHRDIKPENILLSSTGHIKLSDFDLSTKSNIINFDIIKKYYFGNINYLNKEPHINSNSLVGTPEYIAPEIINNKAYTASVDWWEFGILIYEMKFGYTPFNGTNQEETFDNIINLDLQFDNKISISRNLKNLLISLLNKDFNNRIGFKYGSYEIKNHNFFKNMQLQLIMNETPPFIPK